MHQHPFIILTRLSFAQKVLSRRRADCVQSVLELLVLYSPCFIETILEYFIQFLNCAHETHL